ncbi:Hypothetical predicted protein [Lecanosticta acicola]|uniref:CRAL-TRIO domain-containing protein n=1 Tax=Lecanosticta acicola TaxID=111012 RepID=A0AAI9E9X1_9PEZI|nr:Hypothetical predicted protein [Lecanosticta acicola]
MSNNQSQDGADLQRVNSYQWPSGHVGQLTPKQTAALDDFKSLCQSKGYFSPGDDKTPASHDDETLLRYLRARKFAPEDAFGQFKDTEDWRQENKLESLYETIDVDEYEQTRRLYPQWTGRRDKRGIPFYVFEVAILDPKEVTAYEKDSDRKKTKDGKDQIPLVSKVPRKMLRLFALYENLCRFVLPLCSAIPDRPHAETPISQSSNIVDLNGVGFKQFWNLRAHLQDSSRLATAHYPETLDRIFVVGAPSFFSTIWDFAKRWFDPITVQKISILNQTNTLSTLEKFVDIKNIPKKYGGQLEWSFGEMPNLEPEIARAMRWKSNLKNKAGFRTLPIGPIMWRYDGDGDLVAVATGTENGKVRDEALAGLHPEAHVARLALSPGRNPQSQLFAVVSGAGATTVASEGKHKNTTTGGTTTASPETTTNGQMAATTTAAKDHADLDIGKSPDSAVQNTSRAGTYTIPSPDEDVRQGTSSTKLEQQRNTHAVGTLAEGTPETRGASNSQHAVMEPRTVGQAPKETPLYREEGEDKTLVGTAQEYAGQAVETAKQVPAMAMGALGLGEKQEAQEAQESKEPVVEPRIDGMESHQVEEFIRAKNMSREVQDGAQK